MKKFQNPHKSSIKSSLLMIEIGDLRPNDIKSLFRDIIEPEKVEIFE